MESGRPAVPELGPGTVLEDKWRLDSLLARGTTSRVFAATHRNSRRFAIKVMDPRLAGDAGRRERWIKQAYVANAIPHEGVVHTLDDNVTVDGVAFTVMDLFDGETLLSRWQREGRRLRPSHMVEVVLGVLEILSAAHTQGVVHGALSLEHVLIGRNGGIKLCGFGSSRDAALVEVATTLAVDVGKAAFVAPEQAIDGVEPSARADLYAVSAMALALSAGAFVFDGSSAGFHASLPSLATELSRVLDRSLSLDPLARWPSAMSMREAISEATSQAVRVKTGPRPAVESSRGAASSSARPAASAPSPRSEHAPSSEASVSRPALSEARRGTTVLAVTRLDEARIAELEARAVSAGLRVERIGADAGLVLPPALASGRDEANEVCAFALSLAASWPDARQSLVTGLDLLTDQTETNGALKRALGSLSTDGGSAGIRLDAPTARLVERLFEVGSDATGPVLLGERALDASFRQLLGKPTAFVGREAEVVSLVEVFSRSIAEQTAQAALVVAAPGLGKSRLAEETVRRIAERHPEAEIWVVLADPVRRDVAFGVVGEIVDRAAGVSRNDSLEERSRAIVARVTEELGASKPGAPDATRVAEFLAELAQAGLADRAGPAVERARGDGVSMGDQMRFAFLDFISAIVSRRPLAIVVEDLQWADTPSVELLGHLLSLLRPKPLCVIATSRPEVDEVFPLLFRAARQTLAPLDRVALESIAGGALGPRANPELLDRARGNPLHLEEMLRSRAEGIEPPDTATLEEVVSRRVAGLRPELARVLSAASVYGKTFSLAGVSALLGVPAEGTPVGAQPAKTSASLEELCQRELIVPLRRKRGVSEFAFRHALVREVAYARLVRTEVQQAHRTAGVFLERQGEREAAVLAEHFARADAETEAAAWFERSAAEALERHDVGRALELATRGLAYQPRAEVELPLLATKAECHAWRAEYREARETAALVFDATLRGSPLWCRALAPLATGLTRGGDPEGAVALAEQLLGDFPVASDKRALAAASTALVAYLLRLGRSDLVRALMDRLTALASEQGAAFATVAHVESARSWCAMFAGDFSDCLRHDREVVRCFEAAGDLRNTCREMTSIGYDLMVLGMYEDASTAFSTALRTAERLGIVRVVASAKHHLTLVSLRLGHLDLAYQYGVESIDLGRSSADPFALGCMHVYFALVLAARGDEEGAARALEEAITELSITPNSQAWPLAELARVRLAQGRLDQATLHAETAMAVLAATGPAEEGDALVRLTHAEVLAATGRILEARSAIERALRRLEERANRINDATLKQSFLHRVPEHARTLAHARAMGILA